MYTTNTYSTDFQHIDNLYDVHIRKYPINLLIFSNILNFRHQVFSLQTQHDFSCLTRKIFPLIYPEDFYIRY